MSQHKQEEFKQRGDWCTSSYDYIQLCVVEELDSEAPQSAPAIIIFGGFSLCHEHFKKVTNLIKDGTPMSAVVAKMMTVGLNSEEKLQ